MNIMESLGNPGTPFNELFEVADILRDRCDMSKELILSSMPVDDNYLKLNMFLAAFEDQNRVPDIDGQTLRECLDGTIKFLEDAENIGIFLVGDGVSIDDALNAIEAINQPCHKLST